MIAESEIHQMTVSERLQTIEALWESLPSADSSVVSPAWHRKVLSDRKAKVAAGKGVFLTLDSVRKRFQTEQ